MRERIERDGERDIPFKNLALRDLKVESERGD